VEKKIKIRMADQQLFVAATDEFQPKYIKAPSWSFLLNMNLDIYLQILNHYRI
jgi:hypothetical protein